MWSILISCLILLALAANHLIYGFGCWGLQPGGPISAKLYEFQLAVAVVATLLAAYSLLKIKPARWERQMGIIGIALIGAVAIFYSGGWRVFTSMHHQGPENLLLFLSATASAIIAGYARIRTTRHV